MQTLAMVLLLCGLLALVGISLGQRGRHAEVQASTVRVYLADDATDDQVSALKARSSPTRASASVREVSVRGGAAGGERPAGARAASPA